MSKVSCLTLLVVLGVLSTVVDSVSYIISAMTDGIFVGLMIAAVWKFWPDENQ